MRLTPTDASFLYIESVSGPAHISSITTIEGELSFGRVFDHFAERIHLVPAYRQKLAQVPFHVAHPEWVDDSDFDLSNHMHLVQLDKGSTHQDAIDKGAQLNEKMLDRAIPLWQLYVIQGVADKTYLLQATHHAMIDGASGVDLMTIIFDYDPEGREIEPPATTWQPRRKRHALERLTNALEENFEQLRNTEWRKLSSPPSGQRGLLRQALRTMGDFFTRPVITASFNAGLVGPERRLRTATISYADMRLVRQAFGGTINDVVLTVVTEAVARYFEFSGEDPAEKNMRIMCPVNVRTEDQKGALGNRVSGVFPVLPAWPMDLVERLAAVREEMEQIKSDQSAQALAMLQESAPPIWPMAMLPTQLVGTALDPTKLAAELPLPILPANLPKPPNAGINFVCTNVPGVQVPQFLCGHKVLEQVGLLCLIGNTGLGVTIMSYNKNFYFGFMSEPRLLPHVEVIAQAAGAAFEELLARALAHDEATEDEATENVG